MKKGNTGNHLKLTRTGRKRSKVLIKLPENTFPYDSDFHVRVYFDSTPHVATLWVPVLTMAMYTTLLLSCVQITRPQRATFIQNYHKFAVTCYKFLRLMQTYAAHSFWFNGHFPREPVSQLSIDLARHERVRNRPCCLCDNNTTPHQQVDPNGCLGLAQCTGWWTPLHAKNWRILFEQSLLPAFPSQWQLVHSD